MKRLLTISLLLLTLLCSAQQHRALLVGIANYPEESGWRKIHADNDVRLLDSILSKSFHVRAIVDKQATLDNILKELSFLRQSTSLGDTVLISFSCHGQQMYAINDTSEADSLDEALVPYGAEVKYSSKYKGEKHLRDDVLSNYVSKIREKAGIKGLVIVLLDACHSGDSFKDVKESNHYRGGYPVFGPDNTKGNVYKELKNIVRLSSTNKISNVVFISACQSYQLNAEYKNTEGKWYGSLTYAFKIAYEKDGLNNIASLCMDIKSNVESFNKSTRQSSEFATTIDSICENKKIWGIITDANTGEDIIGAYVKIKGATTTTVSDTMGKYTILANIGQTLEVSYSGYTSQSVLVGNQTQIDIRLIKENKVDSKLFWIISFLVLLIVFLIAFYIWRKK